VEGTTPSLREGERYLLHLGSYAPGRGEEIHRSLALHEEEEGRGDLSSSGASTFQRQFLNLEKRRRKKNAACSTRLTSAKGRKGESVLRHPPGLRWEKTESSYLSDYEEGVGALSYLEEKRRGEKKPTFDSSIKRGSNAKKKGEEKKLSF